MILDEQVERIRESLESSEALFIGAGQESELIQAYLIFVEQKGFGGLIHLLHNWVFGSKKWPIRGGSMIIRLWHGVFMVIACRNTKQRYPMRAFPF